MTVRLVRGIEIARIAKTAGFDTLYVDIEHSSYSLDTTGQICMAALATGIAPFVRVPSTRPEHVSRALDAGALGVIAPHIRTAAQAREAVVAAKFPPLGERLASGALPHLHYRSFPAAEANAATNDATMVIVQFESADALEQADAIAAVEGVALALTGTNDLLADMGLAGEGGAADHLVSGGRKQRHCRPHLRSPTVRAPGPAGAVGRWQTLPPPLAAGDIGI